MPSVFTRIIDGELPGRFVWKDAVAVAFLSINPITPGHTLVVPRVEVDHWLDLDTDTWAHCSVVAKHVGAGIKRAFTPPRIGQMIAGFEVPHAHIHVLAITGEGELSFKLADPNPDPKALDDAVARISASLVALGHGEFVPGA
ncbi:MAG: HIT family protein [Nitriliruptoraceae bacterium]